MFLIKKYYKIFIGCEIHISLINNKIFSNNNFNLYDIAYPGKLPIFNIKIINLIFLINKILISRCFLLSIIERKNYFYYDLSKNYQLTQNNFQHLFNLVINNKCKKKIVIKKIHLEEDAASSKKESNFLKINYKRSGNGLFELVTEPNFSNFNCLYFFLKKIKKKFIKHKISNLKMHLGEMRIDLNISVLNNFNFKKSKKTEIKNLNSYENIKKSIKYEIFRKIINLEKKNNLLSQTRNFNINYTSKLRKKCFSKNYNYFIDYDIGYIINFDFEIIFKKKKNWLFFKKFPKKKYKINNKHIFFNKNKYFLNKFFFYYNIFIFIYKNKKKFFFFLKLNLFKKIFFKIKNLFIFNF
ncbi:hypothetical protein CUN91_00740 [Candidatus Carsonella ruddii]|uniref:Aspartyl/Glutamyl-tRNA(Gln) amidotransferase subunit B/E catalytic domain-containing protein n=1 Tax=Carsonella ruddii TaxID=114186 RepID=A0A2K8KDW1_CARRU|nr:hypothetical protein [Candidatus Carsonella ruddii]ATX33478.1 hypothetical protein CUN91_00740 [Candidatus Carsonella ruddii]